MQMKNSLLYLIILHAKKTCNIPLNQPSTHLSIVQKYLSV